MKKIIIILFYSQMTKACNYELIQSTGVEGELLGKHVFSEPHLGVRVQQNLVVVISDTTSVLNLPDHVPYCVPRHSLLRVHVVEVVLHELYGSREVGLVELVGNVPSNRSELPAFLHCTVQEGHTVQHGLPLRHVADLKLLLKTQK